MLNTNVTLDNPFLLSPFFSFFSFFFSFLSFYFSFFYLIKSLCPFVHLRLRKQIILVLFLSFSIYICIYIYNFQYLGRVGEKAVLAVLIFSKASSQAPFLRASGISQESGWRRFCYRLSKDSVLLFSGTLLTWRPSLANVCPELKILLRARDLPEFWL